jgi:hypothetical protein
LIRYAFAIYEEAAARPLEVTLEARVSDPSGRR